MRNFFIFSILLGLLSLSLACSCQQPSISPDSGEQAAQPITNQKVQLYEEYKAVAGKWDGMWTNQTFNSTGASKAEVSINPDGTASITLDLDGFVFGMLNPDPKTFTSTYDAQGIIFEQKDDLFGDVLVTFTKTGESQAAIDIRADNVVAPGIATLTANGTLTQDTGHLDYTVNFVAGNTATGIVDLTKVE